MAAITWIIKNYKLMLCLVGVVALLGGIYFIWEKAYHACQADNKAAASAALIAGQNNGIIALDSELKDASLRADQQFTITQTIGKSNDKTDDQIPAPVLQSVIGSLYAPAAAAGRP